MIQKGFFLKGQGGKGGVEKVHSALPHRRKLFGEILHNLFHFFKCGFVVLPFFVFEGLQGVDGQSVVDPFVFFCKFGGLFKVLFFAGHLHYFPHPRFPAQAQYLFRGEHFYFFLFCKGGKGEDVGVIVCHPLDV